MTNPIVPLRDVPILRSHYYEASRDDAPWLPYTEWIRIPLDTLDQHYRFRFRQDADTVEGRMRLDHALYGRKSKS
jgi:hypothetical protein